MSVRHIKAAIAALSGVIVLSLAGPSMSEQARPQTAVGGSRSRAPTLPATSYRGMYSVVTIDAPGPQGANPYLQPVDGIFIREFWYIIEPKPGVFDFSTLDQAVTQALQNGKKIILSVDAGGSAPAWLEQAPYNVPSSFFLFSEHQGAYPCVNLTVPWPWDPTYLQRFSMMQHAVAAHLQTIPGAVADIVQVKLTGINATTEQIQVPASPGGGPVCNQSDAILTWQQAGYTPNKIIAAWNVLAEATANAFPGVLLAMPIQPLGDFVPITNDGQIVSGKGAPGWVDVEGTIVANTIKAFPGRVAINSADLTAGVQPSVIQTYGQEGAVIGFQNNVSLGFGQAGQGIGCGPQGLNICSQAQYEAILMNGVKLNTVWEEVWAPNVQMYPGDVVKADTAIDNLHP